MSSIDTRNFGIPPEGLGFVAQYFILPQSVSSLAEIDFETTPDAVEIVSELNIERSNDPFWENGVLDSFAAIYTGNLNVSEAGTYTFYLTSDDGSALYIDGQRVINNDGNHADVLIPVTVDLEAGAHEVEIRYFESGGVQTLKLEWAGPDTDGETRLVSSDVVDYAALGPSDADDGAAETAADTARADDTSGAISAAAAGLSAKFFQIKRGVSELDDIDFEAEPAAEEILTEVNFERSKNPWWTDGPRNRFAAEITGQLNVETAGEYTFYLTSDDGSALYIDGERVINNDGRHSSRLLTVTLDLEAGAHDIELRYFEYRGAQTLVLEWAGPDTDGNRETISGDSLSHPDPDADAGADDTDQGDSGSDDNTDHDGHGDSGSGDTDDTTGSDDSGSEDDADGGDAEPDAGSDDGSDHGGHDGTDSGNTDSGDQGDSGDSGSDDGTDHGGHDGTDSGDDTDHGGHDGSDTGDGTDNGGNDGADSGDDTDHGGHDGSDSGDDTDHGGHDDQTTHRSGLMAQFFALSHEAMSLGEIDFNATPDSVAVVSDLDIENSYDPFWDGGPTEHFAARYTGKLNVQTAGLYTIYLTSDDGSALYLNGQRVINNDGAHGNVMVPVTLELAAGEHDLELLYFELWGGQTVRLEWSGPDTNGARTLIDGESLSHSADGDNTDHGGHDGSDSGDDTDHGGHDGSDSGDGTDHDGHDGSDSGDGTDHGGHDGSDSGDDTDHGGHDGSDSGDGTDHGGHDGSDSGDGTDHGGHDGSDSGDDTDHGGHDGSDSGDGTDHGGHDGSDSGDNTDHGGHGGHGDSDEVDHGGANIPGTIPEPTSPDEIDAFVAAVMAEPNAHAHGNDSSMATEHGQLLDLVPRSEATHVAVSDGDWFDPNTWHEGRIPDAGANVLIPKNIAVTYDGVSDASLFTVRVDGELSFAPDVDTRMVVDTLVVDTSGRLEIGTEEDPIAANVNAEIVIANNGDIDVSWDPSLLSRGVISHGQVEIHGAEKTSFLRVSEAPMTGDTTMSLQEIPDGWQVGDTLVLTGTHQRGHTSTGAGYLETEDEEIVITAINGNQITFEPPLDHDHDTPRDDLFAYVANMSRNITFSSEDGEATATHHRGHVMFMHNDDVDVRYAAFEDLGRTDKSIPAALSTADLTSVQPDSNVQGRYSFHFHRTGTEDQSNPAMAVGNTVDGSPGWGFVHHSSNANFYDNVAFDVFGAAFVAEAGDETGSWVRNMAIRAEGTAWGDWEVKNTQRVQSQDTGHTGDGFFFAGRLVEAAENVAANTNNGFVWMMRNNKADPLSENLDHPEIARGTETIQNNFAPIQGFRDNEAFGTNTGITVIKNFAPQMQHDQRSVFDGFLNWETAMGANITYTAHYTLLDFDLINTRERIGDVRHTGVDFGSNTYDLVINGLRVEGFDEGIDLLPEFTHGMSDSDIRHVIIDFEGINNGTDLQGYDPSIHQLLTSDDLTQGRLQFTHNGDTTLRPYENFNLDGTITDSIGTISRDFEIEPLQIDFYWNIIPMLQQDGYYRTQDGQNVMLIDDFITDRATGEMMKITHVITLDMPQSQVDDFANGNYNGIIDLDSGAPIARDDSFRTNNDQQILIDVLANDTDFENDVLTVNGFTDPDNGDVYMQDDGRLLYDPHHGYEGTDSFTYWVTDENGQLSEATVTVEVFDL